MPWERGDLVPPERAARTMSELRSLADRMSALRGAKNARNGCGRSFSGSDCKGQGLFALDFSHLEGCFLFGVGFQNSSGYGSMRLDHRQSRPAKDFRQLVYLFALRFADGFIPLDIRRCGNTPCRCRPESGGP